MGISTGVVPNPIGFSPLGKPNYQEQDFKADVGIKPSENAREPWIRLSKITKVAALNVDPDDTIVFATYPTFDITAVQIGLAMDANVILQVKPVDIGIDIGTIFTYKVSSLHKDPITGAVILDAWAIGDFPIGPTAPATFVGATVSMTILPPLKQFSLSHWECRNDFRCPLVLFNSNSNSETGKLTIAYASGGDAPGPANNDLVAFLVNRSGLIKRRVPVEIRAKRAGCKNVKRMIAYIDRVSVDGKRIELKISKKGLKSKGCAAKKAVDGFKNGEYELESIRWAWRKRLIAGSSNPGGWTPPLWGEGTLRKTGNMGEYALEFAVNAKTRVFSYDEEKKEVGSIGANDYLILAQRIGGIPGFAGVVALVRFKPAGPGGPGTVPGGINIAVFLTGLVWSTEKGNWSAKVKTSLADAEKLGDETHVDRILLSHYCERRPNDPICQDWWGVW